MDRDGTRAGFDCEMTAAVSDAVDIPVIASGGAGTFEHFTDVFTRGTPTPRSPPRSFHYAESSVADLKEYLQARHSGEDLTFSHAHPLHRSQHGRVVQLVQGEKLAIAVARSGALDQKFSGFPRVQLIDLDAAQGRGDNTALAASICARLPCRIGGGIRTVERARAALAPARTP
jgi:imidazole glycerol phosphate synthase subunit HisF